MHNNPAFRKMLDRVEKTNREHTLLKKGDRVVVGFSGGPDSTALLELLHRLRKKYSLTLVAAYLDHQILKTQAKKHQRFCRDFCTQRDILFATTSVDAPKISKTTKRSLEEVGRLERYRFFAKVAQKHRCKKIATAHTLDDQAETVLLRVIRGTGLRGLAAIPYQRKEGELGVIRPVLDCEKNELLALLKASGIQFCRDISNSDDTYTRNRVRNWLLPELSKRFNPNIKNTLANLARIAQSR